MYFTIFYKEKSPLKAIKRRSSKSRKIDSFSKGLNQGSGPKMDFFSAFFYGNIGQENALLRYSTSKKRFRSL